MTVVFMEIGQEVHFVGGDLYEAVNVGIADGYVGGYCVNLLLMILYLYVKIPVIIRRRSFIQR